MKIRRGTTLIEVLMVVGILAVLAGVVSLSLVPRAKLRAEETKIRNDLRQIAVAMAVYMSDNGDRPPLSLNDLAVPKSMLVDPRTQSQYVYALSRQATELRDIEDFTVYGFDPSRHHVVLSGGVFVHNGRTRTTFVRDEKGRWRPREIPELEPGQTAKFLGVRLDGSTGMFPFWEDWRNNLPSVMAPAGLEPEPRNRR